MTPEHPLSLLLGLAVAGSIVLPWRPLRDVRRRYTLALVLLAIGTALAWTLGALGVLAEAPYRVVGGALAVAAFVIVSIEALGESRPGSSRSRGPRPPRSDETDEDSSGGA